MGGQRFRHELKYQVSLAAAEEFFKEIQPFCELDKHADQTASYEIASTYYDTDDFRFYVDREESVGYRRKVRLRSYNKNGESQALFIEIKEKHKQFVSKKRVNLKDSSILQCGQPHYRLPLDLVIENLEDGAEKREIEYLAGRLELHPIVIVRYIRKAFIPIHENDMRITLDTKISGGGEHIDRFDPDTEKFVLDPSQGVLEIKSNQGIPLWLHSVLSRFQFVQTRYSKYCLAVDAVFGPTRPWLRSNEDRGEVKQEDRFKAAG